MSLTMARSGASCGFTFVEGEEYVVYSKDGATVSLCSRTRFIANAQEDIDELGEGEKPGPGSTGPTPEPPRDRTGSCGLSLHAGLFPHDASAAALMAGLVWLGLRRRSRG